MEQDELQASKSSVSSRRQMSRDRSREAEDDDYEEEADINGNPEDGEEEEEEATLRAEDEAERDGNSGESKDGIPLIFTGIPALWPPWGSFSRFIKIC